MLPASQAESIAILIFVISAQGRIKARRTQPAKASSGLNQGDAVKGWIAGNARNIQISRWKVKAFVRNAISVMVPRQSRTRIVDHGGTNCPGVPNRYTASIVKRISRKPIAAVGQSG